MNKLIEKILKFANQVAADHYKREKLRNKNSNVVDIKSRNKKSDEGLTDFSGGAGI